jgi:multidrug efflux pump subunit AcrA (membrane-fusion protein)
MNKQPIACPRLPFNLHSQKVLGGFCVAFLVILFLPWIAFSTGTGQVTAIDPSERVQTVTAPVSGFIGQWYVNEGESLKKGQVIAELSDNDPGLIGRYSQETDAAEAGLRAALLMKDTAEINLKRQRTLFEQGLSARKDYEKAKIEFAKLDMEASKAIVNLTKAQTQFSRQSSQKVLAPRDGIVVRILPGERGQLISAGTPILVFAPEITHPAVEMWVDGTDASMVEVGQPARIQLEGWPSLQISGWPSMAINTFRAKVHLVDQASSQQGKFRVLLTPVGQWPSKKILRLGIQARGYIQLSESFVLREVWRRLNNFPANQRPILEELQGALSKAEKPAGKQGAK